MLALVEQLKGFITGGEVVYMHCWGGRGRAGTIASCFLASCYNLTSEETADRVQLAFDTRKDEGIPSKVFLKACLIHSCLRWAQLLHGSWLSCTYASNRLKHLLGVAHCYMYIAI